MRAKILCVLSLMLMTLDVWAVSDSRYLQILELVRATEVRGLVHGKPSEFALQIAAEEDKIGGEVSREYVIRRAHSAIKRGAGVTKRSCFTAAMRVLTPSGYVPLGKIQEGAEVISWDVDANEPIVNRVAETYHEADVAYGRLCDVQPEGRVLEVTANQPFFAAETRSYKDLARIPQSGALLNIKDCVASLLPRGRFEMVGKAPAVTLKLEKAPNNFIIEGILVYNSPSP